MPLSRGDAVMQQQLGSISASGGQSHEKREERHHASNCHEEVSGFLVRRRVSLDALEVLVEQVERDLPCHQANEEEREETECHPDRYRHDDHQPDGDPGEPAIPLVIIILMDKQYATPRNGQQQGSTSAQRLRQHVQHQRPRLFVPAAVLTLLTLGVLELDQRPSGFGQFVIVAVMGYLVAIGTLVWWVERR